MRKFVYIVNTTSLWLGRLVSPLLFFTMVIVVFAIIMRMLNNAQIWAFELAIFLATGVYAVGGVYALSRRAHVSLDLITARISERKVAILNSITWPFALLFIGVIMWRGFGPAVESFMIRETTATGWDPPLWPMRWLIPIFGFFMFVQAIAMFIEDIHLSVKGEKL